LQEAAELLVQGQLHQRGIAPRISRIAAQASAKKILHWAQHQFGTIASAKDRKRKRRLDQAAEHFLIQYGTRKRDCEFTSDLTAFYSRRGDARLGAAIVLDLQRLGRHLATAAGRASLEED
jgi:hypothetical protein